MKIKKANMKKPIMKKPILTSLICVIFGFSIFANTHDAFQGSWISNSTVYSFQNDSLYVDEINNEGDVYKYDYRNGIIKTTDSFGDEFYFKIDKISDNKIKIQFEGEKPFILNKM